MKDWIALVALGALTSFGVIVAASGCSLQSPFYGTCILLIVFWLWWSSTRLETT